MAAARSPYTVRMALQVHVRPGCYKVGQETVFAGARAIDPTGTYPNSQVLVGSLSNELESLWMA
jgi:hypothetical protein